jgi:Family of unknown function (DUF6263)
MKKSLFLLFALPAVLWSCGGDAASDGKTPDDGLIEFSAINTKGSNFTLNIHKIEDITGTMPGAKEASTDHNEMDIDIVMDVTDVDAQGVATMVGSYTHMSCNFVMGGQTMKYDSNDEPKDDMAKMFKDMIGKNITMKVDKKGHVLELSGDSVMMDMMYPDPTYTRLDNLKEQMELDIIFTDKKVKVGDTWTTRNVVKSMYPFICDNTITLKERKEGKSTIALEGKITPNPDQKPSYEIGMPHTLTLTGKRSSTYVVNDADGWVEWNENKYEMEGESIVTDPKSKKEMKSPIKMTVVDKFTYSR